jgi:hypothetical protein
VQIGSAPSCKEFDVFGEEPDTCPPTNRKRRLRPLPCVARHGWQRLEPSLYGLFTLLGREYLGSRGSGSPHPRKRRDFLPSALCKTPKYPSGKPALVQRWPRSGLHAYNSTSFPAGHAEPDRHPMEMPESGNSVADWRCRENGTNAGKTGSGVSRGARRPTGECGHRGRVDIGNKPDGSKRKSTVWNLITPRNLPLSYRRSRRTS